MTLTIKVDTVEQQEAAAWRKLTPFIGANQLLCLSQALNGEEGDWFREKLFEIAHTVADMPKTYDTDGEGDEATVHLHYFTGGMDWYITERDASPEQHQAFGLAKFFGEMPELGYISIVDLLENGAELDLHWEPKSIREVCLGAV